MTFSIPINIEGVFEAARTGYKSWRDLFLTSPPCTRVALECPCGEKVCSISNQAGITIGLIADVAAKAFDKQLGCYSRAMFRREGLPRLTAFLDFDMGRPERKVIDEQPYISPYDDHAYINSYDHHDGDDDDDEFERPPPEDLVESDDDEDIEDWAEPGGVADWGWNINECDCENCALE